MKAKLQAILDAIENESVSYGEIAFLQAHQEEVKTLFPDNLTLWEWAGIEEN